MLRLSIIRNLSVSFLVFLYATSALAQNDVTITENARKHFRAGVAYIDDPSGPKYEEAFREFHIAYADSPTYRILTNLGLCALNLERDGEAIDAYEKFLASATPNDIPKDKRALMERDIATLKASLVRLSLSATPTRVNLTDERITAKGTTVINRYSIEGGTVNLGIHPGHHRLTASAEGFEPQTWEIEADSATTHTYDFRLKALAPKTNEMDRKTLAVSATEPPKLEKKSLSTGFYVSAISTGVFAASAVVTGLVSASKRSDYETVNAAGNDIDRARDLRSTGKTYALISDIGLGAALLSAGATAYFYFSTPSRRVDASKTSFQWQLTPGFDVSRAGIDISGKF